jgi:rRNA-processing protein FCF1|tara:strand:- start:1163 stop:1558 length:396 start_codon:yes stop_codon:yes gene_type:complete
MQKILLDTNFLLIPAQFKVDIFSEIERIYSFSYKLFILDKTTEELKDIMENQKGKNKAAAKLALKLIAIKKINILKTAKDIHTDTLIAEIAEKGYVVATQDKELKRALKSKNVPIITLRQRKYLILSEGKL